MLKYLKERKLKVAEMSKIQNVTVKKSENAITLIALVITTIFSYDENAKSGNNKGFLLKSN